MGDFIPIVRTKIILPRRRAELLSRQRLLRLIDELLDNRLVIIAAPAGYGKTSLLVDFAHSTQWPVCWYSLDALDQDLQRFIAHFISAINQRFPEFGKTSLAALQSMGQDHLDQDVIVSLLINEVYDHITEHFVLVLDDFHLVEHSPQVVNFVNHFLMDMDENCHVVLASRMLLTLPDLTLMVARAQVGGLSFEELCFQSNEIQHLLRQNYQLDLSDSEAAELARDTEGWVTGLLLSTQLMGKTMTNQLRVARVSGVGLYEYLAKQVLAQQPEDVQRFLLRTALMDEFDARLCEEVIGQALGIQANWRERMDTVLHLNLFVLPVGDDGQYLRYHHLFQEFLRERIQQDSPQEASQILLRLAQVYTERGDYERAYAIYQQMGDTGAIVHLVERAGSSMIAQGRLVTLTQWLETLPVDLLNSYPSLLSLQGAMIIMRGDSSQAVKLLSRAAKEQSQSGDRAGLAYTLNRRSVAYRLLGRYRESLADSEDTLALLEGDKGSALFADAISTKGTVLISLGQLNEAIETLQQSLAAYQAIGDNSAAARSCLEMGRGYKMLGRFADAEQAYTRALEYNQGAGNLILRGTLYNNLGVLQHDRGDHVTATSSFEKAIHSARLGGSPRLESYALTSIGDLYLELDATQETLEAYRQARVIAERIKDGYLMFYLSLVEARLKQTLNDLPHARELLFTAQQMAEERGSDYEKTMVQVEWGRCSLLDGEFEDALRDFNAALQYFVRGGYQNEALRVRLYVLLVLHHLGRYVEAAAETMALRPLLSEPEKNKLLISAGREIKDQIKGLQENTPEPDIRTFMSLLLGQIEQYVQGIPGVRRIIRRHAAVIPFAPPKMIIRSLGKIQVKVSEHTITSSDWQVQTARDLFFLLLMHPEGLTKEQIGEILWPDSTPAELKLRFKNTIYRLRHAAGKEAILFEGDALYLFNRQMDYEYDVDTFLKELSLAEKAAGQAQEQQHYLNAVKVYKGPFLPDLDFEWAVIERGRLAHLYLDALVKIASLYFEAHDYETALNYCQRILKEDSCQEDAHRIAMRVHAAMGNRALVIRQYEQCRQALLTEVDAPPSYQTQTLYETLIQ